MPVFLKSDVFLKFSLLILVLLFAIAVPAKSNTSKKPRFSPPYSSKSLYLITDVTDIVASGTVQVNLAV